ncbi:MAG: AbrB/MazE/SpoVT family DNA-binding domain-containing protein [Acidobacteriaceae bacterium]
MNATITIDKAGRVVVPRKFREALQIKPGDELEIEASEEGLHLRPRHNRSRMFRKNGMWVIDTGGGPLTSEMVNETIHRIREERARRILGE